MLWCCLSIELFIAWLWWWKNPFLHQANLRIWDIHIPTKYSAQPPTSGSGLKGMCSCFSMLAFLGQQCEVPACLDRDWQSLKTDSFIGTFFICFRSSWVFSGLKNVICFHSKNWHMSEDFSVLGCRCPSFWHQSANLCSRNPVLLGSEVLQMCSSRVNIFCVALQWWESVAAVGEWLNYSTSQWHKLRSHFEDIFVQ